MPIIVIFDANFLLTPAQMKLDIYAQLENLIKEPHEIRIYTPILKEIEKKIAESPHKNKLQREFKMAKQLLDQVKYNLIEEERRKGQTVDDFLIEKAAEIRATGNTVFLATNDKELRYKCRANHIADIYVRAYRTLQIE